MNKQNLVSRRAQSFGAFQRYPVNGWYVAAGDTEVSRAPLGRNLLGTEVVLFRKENGDPVAMANRCPHRGFRFSDSKVVGDSIQCGYHGMVFDERGRCTKMASPGPIPNVMRVRAFPLVQKGNFLWIWMGDPERASPADIPVLQCEDESTFHHLFYTPLPMRANVQLARDNLLDETHVSHLHPGLIDTADGQELLSAERHEEIGERRSQFGLRISNFKANEPISRMFHVPRDLEMTRVITVVTELPSLVSVRDQFLGQDGALVNERTVNVGLTPVDDASCYHFTQVSSSFPQSEEDVQGLLHVLEQDVFACESIQEYFEQNPDKAVEISVASDKFGVLSRRGLDRMVAEEMA